MFNSISFKTIISYLFFTFLNSWQTFDTDLRLITLYKYIILNKKLDIPPNEANIF